MWKADLLNELPQYFRTSPFQKSGGCNSKSDPKEESLDRKENLLEMQNLTPDLEFSEFADLLENIIFRYKGRKTLKK